MLVSQRSFFYMQIFFPHLLIEALFYFLSKWFWTQGCHQLIKKSFRASDKVSQAFALGFHPVKIVHRIISENSLLWLLLQESRSRVISDKLSVLESLQSDKNSTEFSKKGEMNKESEVQELA